MIVGRSAFGEKICSMSTTGPTRLSSMTCEFGTPVGRPLSESGSRTECKADFGVVVVFASGVNAHRAPGNGECFFGKRRNTVSLRIQECVRNFI
jgi:hypothetical protein